MIDCDITENYFEEALTTTYSELEPQKAIAIVQAWSDAHPAIRIDKTINGELK